MIQNIEMTIVNSKGNWVIRKEHFNKSDIQHTIWYWTLNSKQRESNWIVCFIYDRVWVVSTEKPSNFIVFKCRHRIERIVISLRGLTLPLNISHSFNFSWGERNAFRNHNENGNYQCFIVWKSISNPDIGKQQHNENSNCQSYNEVFTSTAPN